MNCYKNIKWYIHFGRKILAIPQKVKRRITIGPSHFIPRNIPEKNENLSPYKSCTRTFIEALFIIAKKWRQPRCHYVMDRSSKCSTWWNMVQQLKKEWISDRWYNKATPGKHFAKWMKPLTKDSMIVWFQKDFMILFIWSSYVVSRIGNSIKCPPKAVVLGEDGGWLLRGTGGFRLGQRRCSKIDSGDCGTTVTILSTADTHLIPFKEWILWYLNFISYIIKLLQKSG